MEKHLFLGTNSPKGFVGYFDKVFDIAKTVILKGGPGTGKSTLMKKIYLQAQKSGLSTELYHCSSDTDSLDGVYIPALGYAILDGTSPHSLDAPMPLISQFVVNLADKAFAERLTAPAETIISLIKQKKQHFKHAYCYLNSAFQLKRHLDDIILENADTRYIQTVALEISNEILQNEEVALEKFTPRTLFSTAITPDGIIDFSGSIFAHTVNFTLATDHDALLLETLKRVENKLNAADISFHRYLSPYYTQSVNAMSTRLFAVTKSSGDLTARKTFDLDACLKGNLYGQIAEDNALFEQLQQKAFAELASAKSLHKEIESYYVSVMNFEDINLKTREITDLIFANL